VRAQGPDQQIALGTAQFGLDYGITNRQGRVTDDAARDLLRASAAQGWMLLDTAGGYGDSEQRLGQLLTELPPHAWKVMTKTPGARKDRFTASDLVAFDLAWQASRSRLAQGTGPVHALMVHHADDLLVPGGEILHGWLMRLREEGQIGLAGVSVYDAGQLDALLQRYSGVQRPFDIVQLPASIADQRLLRAPCVQRLHEMGVELHARSLYLQGLLLADPDFVEARFPGKGTWLRRLQAWSLANGLDPVQACLSFFRSTPLLRVAVIGVTNAAEWQQLAAAWHSAPVLDWAEWASNDPDWVDPRRWREA
jgi:aryl-alcohol dehydrogenase-like predicted oxidoreductase